MPIIEVSHLTKEYQLGHITSLKENVFNTFRRLGRKPVQKREDFKALDDVNFAIEEGEVVGIIGHNGSGKSTLLKHLTNISKPTKGKVIVNGSVAPLIEVGAGVNPELTGRENIFLNGAILGIPKKIIQQKLDEIIDFSELEQFIDTPVKRYSSGMTVKLGFSIATSLDADILIVDEVLAVGDVDFQKKCMGKMKDVASHGRTVLFVSHNMEAVKNLCTRAILMEHGTIVSEGSPSHVIETYLMSRNQSDWGREYREHEAPGNAFTRLKSVQLKPLREDGKPIITVKSSLEINISFWNYVEGLVANLSLHLYAATGECVFNVITQIPPPTIGVGLHHARCVIPKELLNTGTFYISFMLVQDTSKPLFNFEEVLTFEVEEERETTNWHGKYPGFVRPKIDFKINP